MYKQIIAAVMTVSVVSTSFAQANGNYCSLIAKNEIEQIQVLSKLKQEINSSSRLRNAGLNGPAAVVGGVSAIDSASKVISDPSVLNVVDLLIDLVYTAFNIKEYKKESKDNKNKQITLDDMIAQHSTILQKAQSEKDCSVDLYKGSLTNLLVERMALQKSGIEVFDKMIKTVEDKKSDSAIWITGAGALGVLYAIYKLKFASFNPAAAGYYHIAWGFVGLMSAGVLVGGGYQMAIDHLTLAPVLNDLKQARNFLQNQFKQDEEQLRAITNSVKLN